MPTQGQLTAALPRDHHTSLITDRDLWASEFMDPVSDDISEHGRCSGLPVEEDIEHEEGR